MKWHWLFPVTPEPTPSHHNSDKMAAKRVWFEEQNTALHQTAANTKNKS
jgi:hypothetical protein